LSFFVLPQDSGDMDLAALLLLARVGHSRVVGGWRPLDATSLESLSRTAGLPPYVQDSTTHCPWSCLLGSGTSVQLKKFSLV
jgi:hypothetical protein